MKPASAMALAPGPSWCQDLALLRETAGGSAVKLTFESFSRCFYPKQHANASREKTAGDDGSEVLDSDSVIGGSGLVKLVAS